MALCKGSVSVLVEAFVPSVMPVFWRCETTRPERRRRYNEKGRVKMAVVAIISF
jgi:hypothetical protein